MTSIRDTKDLEVLASRKVKLAPNSWVISEFRFKKLCAINRVVKIDNGGCRGQVSVSI
jgi:hypothetical protein